MSKHLGDLLSALLDGELSRSAEESAQRHLAACSTCSAEYEQVRTARSWVRALPVAEPPFGFYERILRDSPVYPPAHRRVLSRRAKLAAGMATAAAAVVLVGFVSPQDPPVSPTVNRLVEAHATGASVDSDPLSRLAPIGVPVSFRPAWPERTVGR